MSGQPVVFVPCPGQLACPDWLFEVDGHRHFRRATVRVSRVVPGCWEVWCPCCLSGSVVAQVSSWERAMQRAGEHVAEVHGDGRPAALGEPLPADFAHLPCGGWCLGDCPGCCACGTVRCSGCATGREMEEGE